MSIQIKSNCKWVGKIDWELRKFHGEEFSTHKGSSYNAYLIRDEKTVLIDTVWSPFDKEFVKNLKKEIPLEKIDFIVINHGEVDHSGALPELMRHIPNTPIYCSANCVKSLRGQYHQDWNYHVVKTGERLSLGSKELIFIEAPMLHWPDSMFTYLTGDNILFSNDAFGQHLASERLYNDRIDQGELYQEALKYYANILTLYSPAVTKKIKELKALNLPIDMICPSHGVIWRKEPQQIVEHYLKWADNYAEDQITVAYDTMWDGTRQMAEIIVKGIVNAVPETTVKLYNLARMDKTDLMTEIFKSKAVLIGSSTVNNGMLRDVAAVLEEMRGMKFKHKRAAAFGCYGWSGEAVKLISSRLDEAGFEVVNEGLRQKWAPEGETAERCFEFGQAFAAGLN
ncbi:MAG: MBL fold hydrolase [Chloroflexi bacterium HGW-Chloroflexi-5]|jgi:flavorubredoxin|nr:MAG: MBL fold hydrolase [Chloroflexi bacterium HGW-Chloroflexi-5]